MAIGIDIGGSAVKVAIREGDGWRLGASERYERPAYERIVGAIRSAVERAGGAGLGAVEGRCVGLCCPGVVGATRVVERAVNLPALEGRSLGELVRAALDDAARHVEVVTDARAAALDIWASERLSGRLLAVSIGTGVGACVLDDGEALLVTGQTPGHLGQIDVSAVGGSEAVGRDGARGTLEAYVGVRAWARDAEECGVSVEERLRSAGVEDTGVRALVRAIRISHAVYRPDHVRLLGGVGVRLGHLGGPLRGAIADGLTSLAREGWTLGFGTDDFHAARGAARAAEEACQGAVD